MSRRRVSSSGRFIKRNALLNDPWAKVRAEEAGRYEIDRSTEELRQLGLKSDESKTDGDPGLELDEDVEIALSLAPEWPSGNANGCPTSSLSGPVERIARFALDVPTANVINPRRSSCCWTTP